MGLCGLQIVFLFRVFVCPYLPGKPCFGPEHVRFQSSTYVWGCRRVFFGYIGAGGFSWLGGVSVCSSPFTGLVLWHETDFSFICPLLLSTCSMVKGQEETSTSQARRKRGPGRDTPSTSSIIFSLSMEELRSYYHIPDNIGLELSDGPTESIIDVEDDAVYFTREQLTAKLYFLVSSLIKQFLHFLGALPLLFT